MKKAKKETDEGGSREVVQHAIRERANQAKIMLLLTSQLIFHLFAALADFERGLIRERTQAGIKSARARGRRGGRPKGLSKEAKIKELAAETLYREGKLFVNEIARNLGISNTTLYSYLRYRKDKL